MFRYQPEVEDLERREREEEGGRGVATGGIKNLFAMPAIDYNGHLFLRIDRRP